MQALLRKLLSMLIPHFLELLEKDLVPALITTIKKVISSAGFEGDVSFDVHTAMLKLPPQVPYDLRRESNDFFIFGLLAPLITSLVSGAGGLLSGLGTGAGGLLSGLGSLTGTVKAPAAAISSSIAPAALAGGSSVDELTKLRLENAELLYRIKQLESLLGGAAQSVPATSSPANYVFTPARAITVV